VPLAVEVSDRRWMKSLFCQTNPSASPRGPGTISAPFLHHFRYIAVSPPLIIKRLHGKLRFFAVFGGIKIEAA
jgi:hypothetical protein